MIEPKENQRAFTSSRSPLKEILRRLATIWVVHPPLTRWTKTLSNDRKGHAMPPLGGSQTTEWHAYKLFVLAAGPCAQVSAVLRSTRAHRCLHECRASLSRNGVTCWAASCLRGIGPSGSVSSAYASFASCGHRVGITLLDYLR